MQTPTEKQIHLVENMTHILDIEFPTSSKEYTKQVYRAWIKAHMDDYRDIIDATVCDEDYCYEICENDIWCEHY